MPLTQLDPIATLIVIDLQKGIVSLPSVHPMDEIVARSAQLAGAFRARGLPVVLVHATGRAPGRTEVVRCRPPSSPDWMDLVPELGRSPGDHVIAKRAPGAFIGTNLDERLRSLGVTQVFFTGAATSAGVEASARSAYDAGYNVVTVTDAITDLDAEAHRYVVEKVFPRIGETGTTETVLQLLSKTPQ